VSIHKWSFCPISVLCSKNNPLNIHYMPAVIFFACLDLEQKSSFMDGHWLRSRVVFLNSRSMDNLFFNRVITPEADKTLGKGS
jgi:hypothetical protein